MHTLSNNYGSGLFGPWKDNSLVYKKEEVVLFPLPCLLQGGKFKAVEGIESFPMRCIPKAFEELWSLKSSFKVLYPKPT